MFSIALYGFIWGWKRLEIRTEHVQIKNLPAKFEGYRIVQISDLHLGTFGTDTTYIQRMVSEVNALQPDLIVFTGDLVNTSPDELMPFKNALSRLCATDGVLSIMGNHDYTTYHPDKDSLSRITRIRRLVHDVEDMKWEWLQNASHVVRRGADSLFVVGVENIGRPPFPGKGDLKKAMKEVRNDAPIILLSHDPTHWRREVLPHYPNIGLTLSGHTHAMQFKVAGFSPSQWIYDEWGGHYHEGEQHLIVSTGTGSNIPFRFGAWPEVVMIELNR
jgi:predicted MPP superfamily phosphohydrolase